MAKSIAVDTGFWFALYEQGDQFHELAITMESALEVHQLVLPWPTLYEAVNTRFARRRGLLARFKAIVYKPSTTLIADTVYREGSLLRCLNPRSYESYSLVDSVIRAMLDDRSLRIDAFITFNPKDFADVCSVRGIDLLSS